MDRKTLLLRRINNIGHYSHDISFQGNAHNLLNSFLEEYKRKNDIAEKQLELQREIFEFNKV